MFLRADLIAVPDTPEGWGGLEGSDQRKREALEAIEYGLDDLTAWHFYARLDNLDIAARLYGQKKGTFLRRR